MSDKHPVFPVGSVGHNLMLLRGTWHDHIDLFELDGSPLADDSAAGSGSPGPGPFDNLVYIDFNGEELALTNVHLRGRETSAKTFRGRMVDDLLVFDELGYRRYEWKCNALNEPSCAAARRLGFGFEGIFRQAAIVKGRNRDTAWYSILDREWPAAKAEFEAWLGPDNFTAEGDQRSSLSARMQAALSPLR